MDKLFKLRELVNKANNVCCQLEDIIVEMTSHANYEAVLEDVYVMYDYHQNTVLHFANKRDIILYGSVDEAKEDLWCNEVPTLACDLPKKWRDAIVNQLKHN